VKGAVAEKVGAELAVLQLERLGVSDAETDEDVVGVAELHWLGALLCDCVPVAAPVARGESDIESDGEVDAVGVPDGEADAGGLAEPDAASPGADASVRSPLRIAEPVSTCRDPPVAAPAPAFIDTPPWNTPYGILFLPSAAAYGSRPAPMWFE
jgi:hypothetical protein